MHCIARVVHSIARTVVFVKAWRELAEEGVECSRSNDEGSPVIASSNLVTILILLIMVLVAFLRATLREGGCYGIVRPALAATIEQHDGNFLPKTRACKCDLPFSEAVDELGAVQFATLVGI